MMAAMSASANDELIHRGRRFDFVVRRERLPDGSEIEREIVRHPGAVVIVGLTEGRGRHDPQPPRGGGA